MAAVLQNEFHDSYAGYGNVLQGTYLLFKRWTYFTATIYL